MINKWVQIIAITMLSLFLAHIGLAETNTSDEKLSAILGRGYDSYLNIMREACISGTMVSTVTKRLQLDSTFDQSFQSMFQEKRGFFGAGLNLGFIGGKGRTDFIFRNLASKQRTSLISRIFYEHARLSFNDYKINISAKDALASGPAQVQGRCGDQLINNVKVGSALYVSAGLMFPSEQSFKEFRTRITISLLFGLIKIRKDFVKTFKEVAKDATIYFDVLQLGGDTKDFEILNAQNPGYCSIDNLDTCLDYYDKLLSYVNSGFGKSIESSSLEQMFPLSFSTVDYRFTKTPILTAGPDVRRSGDEMRIYENAANPLIDLYYQRDVLDKRLALDKLTNPEILRLNVKKQKLEKRIEEQKKLMELQLKEGQISAF